MKPMTKISQITHKRVRGSAVLDDEGLFIFTPYRTQEGAETRMKLVGKVQQTAIWVSKNRVMVRTSYALDAPFTLTQLMAQVMSCNTLLQRYLCKQKGGHA